MKTSEEAQFKICPKRNNGVDTCVGDRCMGWRWATVAQMSKAGHEGIIIKDGVGPGPKWISDRWPSDDIKPMGYCGYASIPLCIQRE